MPIRGDSSFKHEGITTTVKAVRPWLLTVDGMFQVTLMLVALRGVALIDTDSVDSTVVNQELLLHNIELLILQPYRAALQFRKKAHLPHNNS